MTIDILTLFPKMFSGPFSESIIKRAIEKGLVSINIHNLRDWATDRHKTADEKPYGGGAGMVMRVDIIDKALSTLKSKVKSQKSKVILLTPAGKLFNQKMAKTLSSYSNLLLICGHYEGVDERVRKLVDEEISIGDYVLTGGELAAMVIVDAVVRLIPGVVGKKESLKSESFSFTPSLPHSFTLLEYPQYTRPFEYNGMKVPKILLSGNHKKIAEWRAEQAIKRTKKRRPDLLKKI